MTARIKRIGMVVLVAGLLAAARAGDGASSAAPAPSASPGIADAVAGKAAFMQYCSICHGVGARGFIGPSIAGITWTAPGLHAIVRGGVGGYGGMPAFNADAVTDANIADIAAYLAVLPPEPPPQPSPSTTAAPVSTPAASPSASAISSATPSVPLAADVVHGRQIFTNNCAACHGAGGQGGVGPSLRGETARKNTAAAIAWIKHPKLPMPTLYPNPLSEKDVDDVAAYIESL